MKVSLRPLLVVLMATSIWAGKARAETGELRIAKQYGLGYLQLMLMEDQKLVEKHAKALGLGDIKLTWGTRP